MFWIYLIGGNFVVGILLTILGCLITRLPITKEDIVTGFCEGYKMLYLLPLSLYLVHVGKIRINRETEEVRIA